MPKYKNFFRGNSSSKYDQDGFDSLSNCDIHSEIGTIKSQLALIKESGATITEATIGVPVPSGDIYLLGKTTGKIWKRTTAGSYSLAHTNGNVAHKGGAYFNGKLYFSTATKLGHFDLSSTWVDSFGTYDNGDALKPMIDHANSLSLYIGDGKDVASVDSSATFTTSALDIQTQDRATDLQGYGDDLVVGSITNSLFSSSKIYRWNTYSSSFYTPDDIEERGVNMLIKSSNSNIIWGLLGTKGNIYNYTGNQLDFYKKIRATFTNNDPYPYNKTTLNGKPLIAIDGVVYSIHRSKRGFEFALCGEYTCSAGADSTINSITAVGNDLVVAWERSGVFGVDSIDTNRESGVIKTPLAVGKFSQVEVKYSSLPASTTIAIATDSDSAGSFTSQTVVVDDRNKIDRLAKDVQANTLQAQVTLNSSTSSTPIIEYIEIL